MSTLAIVQARMGGTRLPGKVLRDIEGRSMLERVVERLDGFHVHIAWPTHEEAESDVLSRFRRVARKFPEVDTFIRVTADCPLLDVGVLAYVCNMYRSEGLDFCGTAPEMDGLDVEVFSRWALNEADALTSGTEREHVTPWMRRLPNARVVNLAPEPLRWSVDDEDGLAFVRRVFAACEHCRDGVPRHTNAGSSIGGQDRHLVPELHHLQRGDLAECTAYDVLSERMGKTWRYQSAGSS